MTALIEGKTGKWEVVIGLETHAQIIAKSKLFSGAATAFGAEPNTQVSPIDAAFPGMLPVINRHCVEQAVKTGLGLDAEINRESIFARKNYFYPDLPAGYQISQYELPIVGCGKLTLGMPDGSTREVGITRLHLEQDAGKSLHDQHPMQTYVDLNRAGIGLMETGGAVEQQTRLFDSVRGETRPMRSKEHAHDYRYFPDPDLLPLVLDEAWIEALRAQLPELPDAKKARFVAEYGLRPEDTDVLVAERATAEYFERVARSNGKSRDAKAAAYWVIGDLFGALNKQGRGIEEAPITPEQLGALLDLIADGTISGRIAKDVFAEMIETGIDAAAIVEKKGLRQMSDTGAIEAAVDAALAAHPAQVAQYHANPKVLGFFVGQVMKATGGKANPALVNELLKKKLGG